MLCDDEIRHKFCLFMLHQNKIFTELDNYALPHVKIFEMTCLQI